MQPSYQYNATITKIVDGDTVDARIDLGFSITCAIRFRLNGIDTMETNDQDPIKRAQGLAAKAFVRELLENKEVTVRTYKTDKYGRWLADFYLPGSDVSVNQMLLNENLAVPYFGGSKVTAPVLINTQ